MDTKLSRSSEYQSFGYQLFQLNLPVGPEGFKPFQPPGTLGTDEDTVTSAPGTLGIGGTQSFPSPGTLGTGGAQSFQPPGGTRVISVPTADTLETGSSKVTGTGESRTEFRTGTDLSRFLWSTFVKRDNIIHKTRVYFCLALWIDTREDSVISARRHPWGWRNKHFSRQVASHWWGSGILAPRWGFT